MTLVLLAGPQKADPEIEPEQHQISVHAADGNVRQAVSYTAGPGFRGASILQYVPHVR